MYNVEQIPFPVIVGWGTFLKCAHFIYQNWQQIRKYVRELEGENEKISSSKSIINQNEFIDRLKFASDYIFIADHITALAYQQITFSEQKRILNDVVERCTYPQLKKRI